MFQSLCLTALVIGADNPYRVVEANPFTVQTVITPAKPDGFYIQWSDGSYAYPGSPVLDNPQTSTVFIVGPWHNNREAIYATLQSPTRKQVEAALAQARETWNREKGVSQSARPFVWPLPSAGETVDPDLTRNGPLPKGFDISGMSRYKRAAYTQKVYTVEGDPRDHIDPVHRLELDNKDWHQSGGMLGIANFRSDLYRNSLADGNSVTSWVWAIDVKNSITNPATGEKYTQSNKARATIFPDGSRFLDVLSNTKSGNVFEIRQRLKEEGRWRNAVIFTDDSERPAGYSGLTKSCVSCHNTTTGPGTGGYATGLVPGSDTVFSIGFVDLEKRGR